MTRTDFVRIKNMCNFLSMRLERATLSQRGRGIPEGMVARCNRPTIRRATSPLGSNLGKAAREPGGVPCSVEKDRI